MLWILVALVVILGFFTIQVNFAEGVGCPPMSTEEKYQQAPLMFSGTVISKEYLESGSLEVTFQINEIFKGPPIAKITLPTFEYEVWGVEFKEEVDYIVIAEYFSGRLAIDPLCGANVNLISNPQFIDVVRTTAQNLGFSSWTPIDMITDIQKKILQDFFEETGTPPLKQMTKFGIQSMNITCKEDLQLIYKKTNDSPACVKSTTAEKLIERGWAK